VIIHLRGVALATASRHPPSSLPPVAPDPSPTLESEAPTWPGRSDKGCVLMRWSDTGRVEAFSKLTTHEN
jgi:hypothetical protein